MFDPAGAKPLYDAVVYVPSAALAPIAYGPSCVPCGQTPSGSPVAIALSGADGSFTLTGVPAGTDVPIVVQIGKWRREDARITTVKCGDNNVDPALTRLPKTKAEGHIPKIAVSTGLDTMECALQTIGIDQSEFTANTGTGSVHIYQGTTTSGATAPGSVAVPASTLWATPSLLSQYDMVLDACQGAAPTDKPQASIDNIVAYAEAGGRLYASHYEHWLMWPTAETSPWGATATQDTAMPALTPPTSMAIDLGTPKGSAFAQWAQKVGATTTMGQLTNIQNARADVLGVTPPSKEWLQGVVPGSTQADGGATPNVYQYSFYTGTQACGKVAYSDLHVSAGTTGVYPFPGECAGAAPDPTATALFEFFFMDALNCTQDDALPPPVPPL